jgi:hypothetical protein
VNSQKLPFLHFMVRIENGRKSYLLAASEVEEAVGGHLVAPIADDGELFPVYQFHYSLYLGNGKYFPDGEGKKLFQGSGLTLPTEERKHLLLTFGAIDVESWPLSDIWGQAFLFGPPRALRSRSEFLLPVLRRVPRQSPLRYGGKLKQKDFGHLFAELEPTDPKVFDRLLEEFHISIIGFGSHVTQLQKPTSAVK